MISALEIIWLLLAIPVFILNLWITAPYGRHKSRTWGPVIQNRIAWIVMESPCLWLVSGIVLVWGVEMRLVNWVLYAVFTFHYIHRTLIYPFRLPVTSRNVPLSILFLAFVFNLINGFFLGHTMAFDLHLLTVQTSQWLFVLGMVIFTLGLIINWYADFILISLKKNNFNQYKIPYGFLFKWVSCPNHLGEIIEWSGFALMGLSWSTSAFAVWTAANLIPRSLAHHRWYQRQFENYPENRKALIPGLL